MKEEIIVFGNHQSIIGILHHPDTNYPNDQMPTVILLNAGLLHRVGPNRLYVKIARELAKAGFYVFRFDLMGIGDSRINPDYTDTGKERNFVDDTTDAMDFLENKCRPNGFLLMGICMGAQIALEVASRDKRVKSLVLMEGVYIKTLRYHLARVVDMKKWKKLLDGQSYLLDKWKKKVRVRLSGSQNNHKAVSKGKLALTAWLNENKKLNKNQQLSDLLQRDTKIFMIFREGNEILYNYRLKKVENKIFAVGLPNGLDVSFIKYADHTFTPVLSQELLLEVIMHWLDKIYKKEALVAN